LVPQPCRRVGKSWIVSVIEPHIDRDKFRAMASMPAGI
jgi:hypothetical protein